MCKTFSSFEQLGGYMKNMTRVEANLFDILSNEKVSSAKQKEAFKELDSKVSSILQTLESKDFLFGTEEKSKYNDYCRNLAAFSIYAPSDKKIERVMLALEMLLENMAPEFKTKLRALKKTIKGGYFVIDALSYGWTDLKRPFFADQFAQLFVETKIIEVEKPRIIVVEKPKIVDRLVEVPVPVPVPQTIIVDKSVEHKEDSDYFGEENHQTEFKSSFLEPPKDASYKDQRIEVCRKICGFLNAEGGKLYIGVDPTTGKAYPREENGTYYGVARDIIHLCNRTYCQKKINDLEIYRRYLKREIEKIFNASNDNVSLFKDCICVEPTKHDNVVVINVKPSLYCVVYLAGIAYQRDGEECKKMDETQILVRKQNLRNIGKELEFEEILRKAMSEKKQVVLNGYHSANSNSIGNRRVEPYEIVRNGDAVICYDLEKKAIRQFLLSRISSIRVTEESWKNEDKHDAVRTDIFGWSYMGDEYRICIDMSLKAMTFFCDVFNASKEQFKFIGNKRWRIDKVVYSLEPVRGFYLYMANEVELQETEDTEMLRKQIRDYVMELCNVI